MPASIDIRVVVQVAPLRRLVERYAIGTAVEYGDLVRAERLVEAYVDGAISDLRRAA